MRIGKKLLLSFLFITIMVGVVGYISVSISKKTLQKTLGKEALHLAISSMREIDEEVYDKIEELLAFANDLSLEGYCIASNSKFDKITDIKNHIDTIDKDWQEGKDTPFIQSILGNKLSKRLTNHLEFYMQKYGYAVFSEIYVANKYGVVIGATNRTSDYLQADEDWYKKAVAENAFWVGAVEYDASSNAITFDIVVNLYDKSGNSVGILKAPLNTEDIRKSIEHIYSESEYKSVSPYLVDKNGRVIFSKLNPELKKLGRDVKLEEYGYDISFRKPVAEVLKGNNGFLSNRTEHKELLTVFSHSHALRDFKGLEWSLIIDYEAEEVFRSTVKLRNVLIIVFVTLIAIASLAGRFIARSISRPLIQLRDASIDLGKGNLNARVDIHSKDEIGQLSVAFNKMVADLKEKEDRLQAYSQELDTKVRERTQELLITNEQLCESVNKYRTLIEQIPAIVYIAALDERGRTFYISPQIKSVTGFSPEEWLADPALWSKQIHPDDRKRVLAEYESSFGKGHPFRSEYRWFTRDGQTLWCYDDATIVKDSTGKPLFYQGVVFDITEHKLASEEIYLMQTLTLAISASVNLHDALVIALQKICNLSGWVYGEAWLPNPDGTFLERNHNFYSSLDNCKIFTERSGEMTFPPGAGLPGRAWSTKQPVWVEDVTLDRNYQRAPIAKEAGLKTGVAFPVITDNDVIAVVVFYHRTLEKRNERLVKLILTILSHVGSIIKRKQAEDSLKRNEARLADSQRIAHLGNWEWDIRKNKVWWSDETYRIFDLTPDEFGGTQEAFLNAVHPADREFVIESLDKALNGQIPYNNEYRIIRPDGSVCIAHSRGEVVYDDTGMPIHIKGTVQDITEHKRIEAEQEKLREQLLRSQNLASVGKLAGGIAHNFNNLLTVIMGYASILKTEMKKDDSLNGYAQKIMNASQIAAHLVQGLLAFSRKQPANPQPVNLNGIIRETESLLLKLIREDIRLETALTNEDCTVMADVGQLEQVLMNLATNARDAMPEGGNLVISTDIFDMDNAFIKAHGYGKTGRYVLVSFSDTGVGMDENTRMRIFEPFFTTKEVGKGTGLGLASVYGIVKQCHGYIDVDSAAGKGATFRIYLPLIESGVSGEKADTEPVLKGGTETILIAEDEEDVRSLMTLVLERNGYEVLETEDGENAINTFLQNKDNITLLIFDIIMPKKNGKEAYEAIKKIKPGVKVLFMSGYGDDVISTTDIHKSGYNYITKPVSPIGLLKKVREILDK